MGKADTARRSLILITGRAQFFLLLVSTPANGQPMVGVYYYPWWGEAIPGGHTFDQRLRAHTTPEAQLPAVGLHHSRDTNVISAHIDQIV